MVNSKREFCKFISMRLPNKRTVDSAQNKFRLSVSPHIFCYRLVKYNFILIEFDLMPNMHLFATIYHYYVPIGYFFLPGLQSQICRSAFMDENTNQLELVRIKKVAVLDTWQQRAVGSRFLWATLILVLPPLLCYL